AVKDRSKLKGPVITALLYDRVYRVLGQDRQPYSYSIGMVDQIASASKLMHEDFASVADGFFGQITSMRALRDFVLTHHTTTRRAIDAMVLSHLIGEELDRDKIDQYAQLWPCPMTDKFAKFFAMKLNTLPIQPGRAGNSGTIL